MRGHYKSSIQRGECSWPAKKLGLQFQSQSLVGANCRSVEEELDLWFDGHSNQWQSSHVCIDWQHLYFCLGWESFMSNKKLQIYYSISSTTLHLLVLCPFLVASWVVWNFLSFKMIFGSLHRYYSYKIMKSVFLLHSYNSVFYFPPYGINEFICAHTCTLLYR